jgi:hypothetical protein
MQPIWFHGFDSAPGENVCPEKAVNASVGRVLRELKGRDTWPHVSVFIQMDGSASRPYLDFAARQEPRPTKSKLNFSCPFVSVRD